MVKSARTSSKRIETTLDVSRGNFSAFPGSANARAKRKFGKLQEFRWKQGNDPYKSSGLVFQEGKATGKPKKMWTTFEGAPRPESFHLTNLWSYISLNFPNCTPLKQNILYNVLSASNTRIGFPCHRVRSNPDYFWHTTKQKKKPQRKKVY